MKLSKSRPDDWAETDEEFKRVIDKLIEEDPDLFAPEIMGETDYSFLNRPRRNRRPYRVLIVAASFFIVVFLSGAFGIWLNQESAIAAKYELDRILHDIKGGFTADNDSTYTIEEGVAELTVHSPDHIDRAEKFLPELIFPDTEPLGYNFKEIAIQKGTDNYWVVSIQYTDSVEEALSVRYFNVGQEGSVGGSYNGAAEKITLEGVTAYYWSEITGTSVLNFINHNVLFTISSTSEDDKDNLLEVARLFIQ